jgi:hypothetical protein
MTYGILTYTEGTGTMKVTKKITMSNSYELEIIAWNDLYNVSESFMGSLCAGEPGKELNSSSCLREQRLVLVEGPFEIAQKMCRVAGTRPVTGGCN